MNDLQAINELMANALKECKEIFIYIQGHTSRFSHLYQKLENGVNICNQNIELVKVFDSDEKLNQTE